MTRSPITPEEAKILEVKFKLFGHTCKQCCMFAKIWHACMRQYGLEETICITPETLACGYFSPRTF